LCVLVQWFRHSMPPVGGNDEVQASPFAGATLAISSAGQDGVSATGLPVHS
jgi:hypothetical protein